MKLNVPDGVLFEIADDEAMILNAKSEKYFALLSEVK